MWAEQKTYSIVSSAQHRAIARHGHAGHRNIVLGDKLVRAFVLSQIPNANISSAVTANELTLIWVDDHIVDRYTVGVTPLHISTPRIPNLHRPIF